MHPAMNTVHPNRNMSIERFLPAWSHRINSIYLYIRLKKCVVKGPPRSASLDKFVCWLEGSSWVSDLFITEVCTKSFIAPVMTLSTLFQVKEQKYEHFKAP